MLPPTLLSRHYHLNTLPRGVRGEDSPRDDTLSQQLTCPGQDAISIASYEAVSEPPASAAITGVRVLTQMVVTAIASAVRRIQATLV